MSLPPPAGVAPRASPGGPRSDTLSLGGFLQGALIMANVPFALAGGVAALWLRGHNFSTSAIIGFIAVFGVAVLNGVVMVSYINEPPGERRGWRMPEPIAP